MAQQRYPGAQPFQPDQEKIFFGREADLDDLRRRIKLAPLSVLYGKSGLGKSSLVNAGLIPDLRRRGRTDFVRIRFGAAPRQLDASAGPTPAQHCREAIGQLVATSDDYLTKLLPEDLSIWRMAKSYLTTRPAEQELLLIFDQFEELFTYSAATVTEFKRQIAETLHTAVPQRYWDALEQAYDATGTNPLTQEETIQLQAESRVKVLFVVRSDRLHLLEKMSDFLPAILRNCQELLPLDLGQAREAILVPARLRGYFSIPPFDYEPDAVNDILSYLTRGGTEYIESTQLQIICHSLAESLVATGSGRITTDATINLAAIIENYYEDRIGQIVEDTEQLAARRLIEEGLIFAEEERRLSLYEGQLLKHISPQTLRILTDGHLLRAEPSLRGGYTYELSHDTLVAPILKARDERWAEERRLATQVAARQRVEELAVERQKRRIAYAWAAGAMLLALIAIVLAVFAYRAQREASREAFTRQFESARRLKLEGLYAAAIGELDTLIPVARRLGRPVVARLVDTADAYRQISRIMAQAEEPGEDSLRVALESYRRAAQISNDSRLTQLVVETEAKLADRISDEKERYINFLRAGQPAVARELREVLLMLDPSLAPELDSIRSRYLPEDN